MPGAQLRAPAPLAGGWSALGLIGTTAPLTSLRWDSGASLKDVKLLRAEAALVQA